MTQNTQTRFPKPTLKWLFFSFRGRIGRQSFAFACLFILVLLGLAVYQSVQGVNAVQAGRTDSQLVFAGFLSMATIAFGLWSILALTVKRLKDLNQPAGLVIILFVAPVNFLFLLFLMVKQGSPETNEHGPPPFSR